MKILSTILLAFCTVLFSYNIVNAQWVQTEGAFGSGAYCFATIGGDLIAGTYLTGFQRLEKNSTTWMPVADEFSQNQILAMAVSGTNLFAAVHHRGVYLSTDNGSKWNNPNTGSPSTVINIIDKLAVMGSYVFAGYSSGAYGNGGVFLSTDNGTSWSAINTGLRDSSISSLAVSGTNLFAGTYKGGVFLSTDNGSSWTSANNGLGLNAATTLEVSGTNLFAGTNNGMFLSTDMGMNWKNISTGLTDLYIFSLAVFGSNIFVGTRNGNVFYSNNNGTSWLQVRTGTANYAVIGLTVYGGYLYAGVSENGSTNPWRRPLSDLGITEVSQSEVLLDGLQLSPNPVSGLTTIDYSLSESGTVSLTLTNSLGIESAKISNNQIQEAGSHSINYDASTLTPGVYFLTIKAGNNSGTKKFVVVK